MLWFLATYYHVDSIIDTSQEITEGWSMPMSAGKLSQSWSISQKPTTQLRDYSAIALRNSIVKACYIIITLCHVTSLK